jgi:hypothetical protein
MPSTWCSVQHYLLHVMLSSVVDTKGAIRIRISKKNRQHNGQKNNYKRPNNDLQNIHIHKTKDRVTRTPLKPGGELRCFGRVGSSCSTGSGTRRVVLMIVRSSVILLLPLFMCMFCRSLFGLLYFFLRPLRF